MRREPGALGIWTHHQVRTDRRGDLTEALRIDWMEEPLVQVNVSRSATNVVRGMHLHRRQWDYWYVAQGRFEVHLADHEPHDNELETEMRILVPGQGVAIPPGVMHGFLALEPAILIYGQTQLHDPNHPDDEAFYPFDERIRWSVTPADAVVSDRDLNAPPIR